MAGRRSLSSCFFLQSIILIFWCSKQRSEKPSSNLKFQGWWWWSVTQAGIRKPDLFQVEQLWTLGAVQDSSLLSSSWNAHANVHASVTSSPVFSLVHAANSGSQKVERARWLLKRESISSPWERTPGRPGAKEQPTTLPSLLWPAGWWSEVRVCVCVSVSVDLCVSSITHGGEGGVDSSL